MCKIKSKDHSRINVALNVAIIRDTGPSYQLYKSDKSAQLAVNHVMNKNEGLTVLVMCIFRVWPRLLPVITGVEYWINYYHFDESVLPRTYKTKKLKKRGNST